MPAAGDFIDGALDLAAAQVTRDGARLAAASKVTAGVLALAAAMGLAAAGFLFLAWRAKKEGIPLSVGFNLLGAAFFAALATAFAFGAQSKTFTKAPLSLRNDASLFGFSGTRAHALPAQGTVRVSFLKEYPTSTSKGQVVIRYRVEVDGVPASAFTVGGERDLARGFGKDLAAFLGYALDDRAEDDGVERVPPR